jgi:voltage-gated potassium channel
MLFLYPTVSGYVQSVELLRFFYIAVLLAGLYAISNDKRTLIGGALLSVPSFFLDLVPHTTPTWEVLFKFSLGIGFHLYMIVVLMRLLLKSPRVTQDTLNGAICVYLLLGLMWAIAYEMLYLLQPQNTFVFTHPTPNPSWNDFVYYSFITLTTVGYGDMMPVSGQARTLSMMEAICGLLFLTVMMARLVGLYQLETHGGKN